MRRPFARFVLLFLVGASTGCVSSPSTGAAAADVELLLERMRRPAVESEAHVFDGPWQADGPGRMLTAKGRARIVSDEGRYMLRLDGEVPYAEVHDGSATWKLLPWGSVVPAEGGDEEISLVPIWVLTGYWLDPDAPVVISGGRRHGNTMTLEVRLRDGVIPFEVQVDVRRAVPVRVTTAGGVPLIDFELDDHRAINGRTLPATFRSMKNGSAVAEVTFGAPRPVTPGPDAWARPEPVARATFHRDATEAVEARNDGNGFLFVKPVIDGQPMGWFLFDTGAPSTIVGLAAKTRLGLSSLGDASSTGVGGHAGIEVHAVDSVRLGPVEVGPTVVASMDVLRLGWRHLPIEGIIGCDLLGHAVVEYDIASASVAFRDPATYELPPHARWEPILLHEGKPILHVRFEDHEGDFLVDTGAGSTFSISKPLVDRLDLLAGRTTRNAGARGVGGRVTMQRGTVRWLELGGTRYENVSTQFAVADQGSHAQAWPDGIVGIPLLDDYRVVFDLGNGRMAFLERLPSD